MNKREIAKRLKVCELRHGAPDNSADVYGHDGRHRDRTCIRIHGTDTWVYSPSETE
jgi:hypothetical protein